MSNAVLSKHSFSSTSNQPPVSDRLMRGKLFERLSTLRSGQVSIEDSLGVHQFGVADWVQARVLVRRSRFYSDLALGGALAAGESFVRGDWECDNLSNLLRIFARDARTALNTNGFSARLVGITHRLYHWWRSNTRTGSRRNIAAHYDLGNDFYRLWLDDTMAYSCGLFKSAADSMREASIEKFERICQLLNLRSQDEVVEIGTGWGGFAIHAAANYGCRITTTTISREQFAMASERVHQAGLSDRVRVLPLDYRDLTGQFDKLVSIEMIEAVGHKFLNQYFHKCSLLLKPRGSMVLQAIVMPERGYDRYLRTPDFINRYVFPGGCLPSLSAILDAVGKTTDLRFVGASDHAADYAETLRRWRTVFNERLCDVQRLGFDEEFIRLWTYYLCYCEAAFEERCIGMLQMRFDKPASHR